MLTDDREPNAPVVTIQQMVKTGREEVAVLRSASLFRFSLCKTYLICVRAAVWLNVSRWLISLASAFVKASAFNTEIVFKIHWICLSLTPNQMSEISQIFKVADCYGGHYKRERWELLFLWMCISNKTRTLSSPCLSKQALHRGTMEPFQTTTTECVCSCLGGDRKRVDREPLSASFPHPDVRRCNLQKPCVGIFKRKLEMGTPGIQF